MLNQNIQEHETIPSAYDAIQKTYSEMGQAFQMSWLSWPLSLLTSLGWHLQFHEKNTVEFFKIFNQSNALVQSIFLLFLDEKTKNSFLNAMAIYRMLNLHGHEADYIFNLLPNYPHNILDHQQNITLLRNPDTSLDKDVYKLYQQLKLQPHQLEKLLKINKNSRDWLLYILSEINFDFNGTELLEMDESRLELIDSVYSFGILNATTYQLAIHNNKALLDYIYLDEIKNFNDRDYQIFQLLNFKPENLRLLTSNRNQYDILESIQKTCLAAQFTPDYCQLLRQDTLELSMISERIKSLNNLSALNADTYHHAIRLPKDFPWNNLSMLETTSAAIVTKILRFCQRVGQKESALREICRITRFVNQIHNEYGPEKLKFLCEKLSDLNFISLYFLHVKTEFNLKPLINHSDPNSFIQILILICKKENINIYKNLMYRDFDILSDENLLKIAQIEDLSSFYNSLEHSPQDIINKMLNLKTPLVQISKLTTGLFNSNSESTQRESLTMR